MADPGAGRLQRLINAFGYTLQGFSACFRYEAAFRQELFGLLVMAPLGLWLGQNGVERALLVGCLIIVPLVELLNSAVEAVVDRLGGERHELAGRAKDMGSAAVFLSIVLVLVVWLLVLA